MDDPDLAKLLRAVFKLLERTEPVSTEYDTQWLGPYYIPRRGEWHPARFLRYRDELYCTLELGWSLLQLVWRMGTDEVSFEGHAGVGCVYHDGPELWVQALEQIERRLRSALADPEAYNQRVARLLPLACREGRILRHCTWPKGWRPPPGKRALARLEALLETARSRPAWRELSVRRYLDLAAVGYDAAFRKLRRLAPLDKYRQRADTRHAGMLDLSLDDPAAFERWYTSGARQGAHPFEIVFAHPHGILLSPLLEGGTWRFVLSVDTLGLYAASAKMAMAMAEQGAPIELFRQSDILSALRGEDWVEVGPFHDELSLAELRERRSDAVEHVEWKPVPRIWALP